MKRVLTMITAAAALVIAAAPQERILPLKAEKKGIAYWNTSCKTAVQDGKGVKLELRELGKNFYQASATYSTRNVKPGDVEFTLEISTKDSGFNTVHFYLPLQPKAKGAKIQRRYTNIPLDEFDTDGEIKKYSVKVTIPETELASAGFGIEFRSKKPASVTIHSAVLTPVQTKKAE